MSVSYHSKELVIGIAGRMVLPTGLFFSMTAFIPVLIFTLPQGSHLRLPVVEGGLLYLPLISGAILSILIFLLWGFNKK